jgi:hypothetical protein
MNAFSTHAPLLCRAFTCAAFLVLHVASIGQTLPMIDKLKSGGPLVIAHREASIPFSFVDKKQGNRPAAPSISA